MDEITNAVTVTPEVPQNSTMPLDNINQGTVAIEASRAIAEAQGKLVIAKRFPRNEIQAFANMKKACQRTGLANKAFYSYPRGGETVSGPTSRRTCKVLGQYRLRYQGAFSGQRQVRNAGVCLGLGDEHNVGAEFHKSARKRSKRQDKSPHKPA